jgi:hypothetical protein
MGLANAECRARRKSPARRDAPSTADFTQSCASGVGGSRLQLVSAWQAGTPLAREALPRVFARRAGDVGILPRDTMSARSTGRSLI